MREQRELNKNAYWTEMNANKNKKSEKEESENFLNNKGG